MNMFSTLTAPVWRKSIGFLCLIYCVGVVYGAIYRNAVNVAVWSEAMAFCGGVLIGISFVLAPMSYFFNFLDKEVRYRKYLGLLGFYMAFLYSVSLMFRFPQKYFWGLPTYFLETEVVLGLGAMSIFSLMAVVSGPFGMKLLGHHWRAVLRTGYLGYFFLVVRAVLVEGSVWQNWLVRFDTLPPPRLLLSIFAILVIIARLVMLSHQILLKKPLASNTVPGSLS